MKRNLVGVLFLLVIGFFIPPVLLAEEVTLRPETEADFGSGASVRQDYYLPGNEAKGMIIGHPNPITRGDRALVRINLDTILLRISKIEKAELVVHFDSMYDRDPEATRHVLIERMNDSSLTLSGAAVSSRDADPVAEYDVKRDDLITPSGVPGRIRSPMPDPLRIDVTETIKTLLKEGSSSVIFRFSDTQSEVQVNDTGGAVGILIPTRSEVIPQLQLSIAD